MRKVWHFLSLCVTPLCVAVLLCEPRSLAQVDEAARPLEGSQDAGEEEFGPPKVNLFDFGYRSKDPEGRPWQEGEHHMPPPFSMQLLNFIVFGVLLYRMAGPSPRHRGKQSIKSRAPRVSARSAQGAHGIIVSCSGPGGRR